MLSHPVTLASPLLTTRDAGAIALRYAFDGLVAGMPHVFFEPMGGVGASPSLTTCFVLNRRAGV